MSVSLARLRGISSLAGFTEEQLRETGHRLEPLYLEANQALDTSTSHLWLLLEGELGLEVGPRPQARFLVGLFHPGCVLSATCLHSPRGLVIAQDPALLGRILEADFDAWLETRHEAARRLQHQRVLTLVRQLRTVNTCLVHISSLLDPDVRS